MCANNVYKDEFKVFKKSEKYKFIFDKKAPMILKNIQRDTAMCKHWKTSRWGELLVTILQAVIVTPETMPEFYNYIHDMCKRHNMRMPAVFVTTRKGFFNALAQKMFATSGVIIIGQDLVLETSDATLEGIVAHEMGHVKYEHINKTLALYFTLAASMVGALRYYNVFDQKMYGMNDFVRGYSEGIIASIFAQTVSQLLIGKRFEKQADEFAYKEMNRGEGLAQFFEKIQQMEKKVDQDFDDTYAFLQDSKVDIDGGDYSNLMLRYYLAKLDHKISKGFRWLYHNTRFGPHPSPEERIKTIREYMATQ